MLKIDFEGFSTAFGGSEDGALGINANGLGLGSSSMCGWSGDSPPFEEELLATPFATVSNDLFQLLDTGLFPFRLGELSGDVLITSSTGCPNGVFTACAGAPKNVLNGASVVV